MTDLTPRERLRLLSLERPDQRGNLRTIGLGTQVQAGEVLGGVDMNGRLHVLVPLESGTRARTDLRSRGVGIQPVELPAAHVALALDLHCRNATQNYVFEALADDVVAAIGEAPEDAATIPFRMLERWRQVFQRPPSSDMPRKQLIGLLGELLFLKELLVASADLALDIWTGPANQPHDFSGATASLEVKTTEVSTDRAVEIHGLEQLEPKAGSALFLGYARLESHLDGQSAAELIDQIAELSGQSELLYAKLGDARYVDSPVAHERFLVRELSVFPVGEQFPKLTRAMLIGGDAPQGVSSVSYTIDLGTVGPALSEPAVEAVFEQIAGGNS